MLVRLLYASRASNDIDDDLLSAILRASRDANPEHGITGVLCAYQEGGTFLQVLEGSRQEVNALYNNVVRDTRHMDIMLLHYEEIVERRFSGWRMGTVDLNKVNPGTILRFSENTVIDPHSMSGIGALALLEEMAASALNSRALDGQSRPSN